MNHPIVVIDDHPAVRMAVCRILESEGFEIIGQADNGVDGLSLLEQLQPCTVILDIGIPGIDGLTVINQILSQKWTVKIVVLTGMESGHMATRCVQSGAHGFVSKQSELFELVNAVRAVQANYNYFPSQFPIVQTAYNEIGERKMLEKLSTRELRVLQQLVQGLSNKEIADRMLLSTKTVSTYKTRLLKKLKVGTVLDLYVLAQRHALT